MQILRASEDYLETMLMMQQQHGYIRSIDVAEHLGVTKPSVTYATKRLRENGYITMDKDGLITLTDTGMTIAESMLDRHHTLTRFLMALAWTPPRRRPTPARWSTTSARRALTRYVPTRKPTCDKQKKERRPAGRLFFAVYGSMGRRMVKVVPSPSRLSRVTVPWW